MRTGRPKAVLTMSSDDETDPANEWMNAVDRARCTQLFCRCNRRALTLPDRTHSGLRLCSDVLAG
jgi:hypothetical protein